MTDRTVLVDTSVWIDYLRDGRSPQAARLDELLSFGGAALCDPVKAEVLSGARSRADLERLKGLLGAVVSLKAPQDIWERVAEDRFVLARRGVKASLIDLWIIITARENGAMVWTLDKDFRAIHKIIPFEMFEPVVSLAGMLKTNKKIGSVDAFVRELRKPRHTF